jgi:CBS domain-containing protein
MKVADVMTRGIDLVAPEASVQDAAGKMAEEDVGAVVVGRGDALEGVLTARDHLLRVVVEGLDASALAVRDVMSSTVYTCREDDDIEAAFRQMSERQVRRLPVLGPDGRVSGIVTLSDLGRLERDPRRATEALREIAEPHRRRASAARASEARRAPKAPGATHAAPRAPDDTNAAAKAPDDTNAAPKSADET